MNVRSIKGAEQVICDAMGINRVPATIAVALDASGWLNTSEAQAELTRLRLLQNAMPADLSEAQLEALIDAGNRARNDYYHERACSCSEWPTSCATDPDYANGYWDSDTFAIAAAAVIGAWEAMRARAEADEVARLQTRVEELETFAQGCDGEGCVLPHSSWCQRAIVFAESHNGCTCGRPWEESPQPHAGHCWLLSPPQSEIERMRARVAELEALKPAAIQTCRTCGAGYSLGQACSVCLFHTQMAAAHAAAPHEGPEPHIYRTSRLLEDQ
nr:hypothetical protein OG409_07770 [Streptomyces sp. NBC_00974]